MKQTEKTMKWGRDDKDGVAQWDEKIADDLYMFGGFGNVGVAITPEGLVIIDCSIRDHAQEILKRIRKVTDLPVHTIIYTHGHLDHAGGGAVFAEDAAKNGNPMPRIVAHALLINRFDKYKMLAGHQLHVSSVQYARGLDKKKQDLIGKGVFLPPDVPYPNATFQKQMAFRLGELTFELYHSMGETDDNIWTYIPERKTVVAGDALKRGVPNIGNPFKVMLRYETEWADAMEAIAGLKPDFLMPGHGPVLKGDEIQAMCLAQARFLRYLHREVIKLMNEGCWLEEILERVKVPDEIMDAKIPGQERGPLNEAYGCRNFVIHGIWNRYAGWYNGQPTELFPAPRKEIAAEVLHVSGADKVMERARELAGNGKVQLALNLLDFAVHGAEDKQARKKALLLKSELLDKRAEAESNGMAKNLFVRGAIEAGQMAKEMN